MVRSSWPSCVAILHSHFLFLGFWYEFPVQDLYTQDLGFLPSGHQIASILMKSTDTAEILPLSFHQPGVASTGSYKSSPPPQVMAFSRSLGLFLWIQWISIKAAKGKSSGSCMGPFGKTLLIRWDWSNTYIFGFCFKVSLYPDETGKWILYLWKGRTQKNVEVGE